MRFQITTTAEGQTLEVRLAGEFDINAVDEFRAVVEERETAWRRAEIDLADVVFMDSSGLGALVALDTHARERGHELTLVRPSLPVSRLLQLTGLDSHFTVRT
jgi:anti-sigma B factor antagonist